MSDPGTTVIGVAVEADARAVAELHRERISEGFLATLGLAFLTRLYRRMARSQNAFLLVATRRARIVGFVAATTSTSRFYREFLLRDGVMAGVSALPAIVRAPRRVYETLRYGAGTSEPGLPTAELVSIAVASDTAGHGVGTRLSRAVVEELGARGVHSARVVTGVDNEAAIRMYQSVGFRPVTRTEVHRGTPQELLVWE